MRLELIILAYKIKKGASELTLERFEEEVKNCRWSYGCPWAGREFLNELRKEGVEISDETFNYLNAHDCDSYYRYSERCKKEGVYQNDAFKKIGYTQNCASCWSSKYYTLRDFMTIKSYWEVDYVR